MNEKPEEKHTSSVIPPTLFNRLECDVYGVRGIFDRLDQLEDRVRALEGMLAEKK